MKLELDMSTVALLRRPLSDAAVSKITCPVIFFGGKGGPATGTFDGFKKALPSETKMEMVIANIENAGTGGKNALSLHDYLLASSHHCHG